MDRQDEIYFVGIPPIFAGISDGQPLTKLRLLNLINDEVALLDEVTGKFLTAAPVTESASMGNIGLFSDKIGPWEHFKLRSIGQLNVLPLQTEQEMIVDQIQLDIISQERKIIADRDTNYLCLNNEIIANALSVFDHDPTVERQDPLVLPRSLDGLCQPRSAYTPLRSLNRKILGTIQPRRMIAVVTSIKNEGIYILEWIAHCRAVGIEHIFIYTNDNSDGSLILLQKLHSAGVIELLQNDVGAATSPQARAYEHSLTLLPSLRDFEWVAYFDTDEFLIPSAEYDYSVINLLQDLDAKWPNREPAALCLNWDWYGSNRSILRTDGLLQERFLYSRQHDHVKSIVRPRKILSMLSLHIPDEGKVHSVNSSLEKIDIPGVSVLPVNFSGAKLNHYYQKSFEEFGVKMNRGEGSAAGGLSGKSLQSFFDWDISSDNGTYSPTPEILIGRVGSILKEIRELAGIIDAESICDANHRRLAAEFYRGNIERAHAHYFQVWRSQISAS